jgi:hypothetical protein
LREAELQRTVKAQWVKESGESECLALMARIGQYPRRKAADFQMVLGEISKQEN